MPVDLLAQPRDLLADAPTGVFGLPNVNTAFQLQQMKERQRRTEQDVRSGLLESIGLSQTARQELPKNASLIDKLVQGISSYAPYAVGGEALAATRIPRLAAMAGASGAYGGVVGGRPEDVILGGLLGAGGEAAGQLVKALSPTAYLRRLADRAVSGVKGLRTPEAVKEIAEKVGDVPLNIFEAIGYQPGARQTISTLGILPFSGAGEKARQVQEAIGNEGEDLYTELMGESTPETLTDDVQSGLQNVYETNKDTAGELFSDIANKADEKGVQVKTTNLANTADQLLKEENKKIISDVDPRILRQLKKLSKLKEEPAKAANPLQQFKDLLTQMKSETQYSPQGGELRRSPTGAPEMIPFPPDTPTLLDTLQEDSISRGSPKIEKEISKTKPEYKKYNYKDAHFAHSHLSKLERDLNSQQKFGSARIVPPLQEALQADMEEGLKAKNLPELQNEWKEARKNFAQTVVPFRQKSIYNKMQGDTDPSNLHTELTKAQKNSQKVLDQLPIDLKNKIGSMFIHKSIKKDELNPVTMGNAYDTKIPDAVQKKLFTEPQQESFDRLNALIKSSPETRLWLESPFTGGRTWRMVKGIATGAAALGLAHAGLPLAETLGGLGILMTGGRGLQEALTSPRALQAYISSQGKKGILEKTGRGISPLISSITLPPLLETEGENQ